MSDNDELKEHRQQFVKREENRLKFVEKNVTRSAFFHEARTRDKKKAHEARAARRNRLNGAFGNEQNPEIKALLLFGTSGFGKPPSSKKNKAKATSTE